MRAPGDRSTFRVHQCWRLQHLTSRQLLWILFGSSARKLPAMRVWYLGTIGQPHIPVAPASPLPLLSLTAVVCVPAVYATELSTCTNKNCSLVKCYLQKRVVRLKRTAARVPCLLAKYCCFGSCTLARTPLLPPGSRDQLQWCNHCGSCCTICSCHMGPMVCVGCPVSSHIHTHGQGSP